MPDRPIARARLGAVALPFAALIASGLFTGCAASSDETVPPVGPAEQRALQRAAVKRVLDDVNATGPPRAYDAVVLRSRMTRYVPRDTVARRVRETVDTIGEIGGRDYWQPHLDSITVGSWEGVERRGDRATVSFVGYETVTAPRVAKDLHQSERYARDPQPLQRFTVHLLREGGMWKLLDRSVDWLTPAGPMDEPGTTTIKRLAERQVFVNQ